GRGLGNVEPPTSTSDKPPSEHTMTTTTPIRSPCPEQYETNRPSDPARPLSPHAPAWAWLLRADQRSLDDLPRTVTPVLRPTLAFVYIAFGALKIAGLSPVGELVASMVPFLPETPAVIAMGVFEVVAGLLIAFGLFVPWVAAAQVVHLLGTFA